MSKPTDSSADALAPHLRLEADLREFQRLFVKHYDNQFPRLMKALGRGAAGVLRQAQGGDAVSADKCTACGDLVKNHRDGRGRSLGCLPDRIDQGRLLRLKAERNAAARAYALSTVRETPHNGWQARIGGRVRGRFEYFPSRRLAEQAVHDHYNTTAEQRLLGGR